MSTHNASVLDLAHPLDLGDAATVVRRWKAEHWLAAAIAAMVAALGLSFAVPYLTKALAADTPAPQASVALAEVGNVANISVDDKAQIVVEGLAAEQQNAAIPTLNLPLEQMKAFGIQAAKNETYATALKCLTQAVYYEAANEPLGGRRAVAQVVLNRVRHPAFPHSVCEVVYQRTGGVCQFTFACDGALARIPVPAVWERSLREAREALAGQVETSVGMATHYHADYVYPAWAPRLEKVAAIGQHLFYRWPLGWGRRKAFAAAYTGIETGVLPVPVAAETGGAEAAMKVPDQAGGEIAPRRSQNEGGYVDTSKGWRPSIADVESEAATGTSSPPSQ